MMEMRIDTRLIAVMLAVVALAVCAVCVAEDSDAASGKTVSVYAEVDGRVVEMTGTGNDLSSAIEDAVSRSGYEVNLGPANIISFNGQDAPSGKYWTIQQWQPPRGWEVVTFNDAAANFVDGTSYFLYLAERSTTDGYSSYTAPDYEPEATAYFFIQFKEDVNRNSYVTSVLTEEQRSEGFWISGTGSNAAWAFKDACEKLGFELNMSDGVKGGIVDYDYIGWLNSFLGLEDELLSGSTMDGSWKYWSQFYWDDSTGSWVYGETLGHYDPAVTQYFALIRQVTTKENVPTNLDQDPSDAPLSKINNGCTVRFVDGNGTVIKTQSVPYFGSATAPANPTKNPSDGVTYTFTGWDKEFDQVITDLTVNAQFSSSGTPTDPDDPGTTTVPVTGVTISDDQKELEVGDSYTFTASISPSNATNKSVTWTTSNPSVVTVNRTTGEVTAVGPGTATVTVTTADGNKTDSVMLTVTDMDMYISVSSSSLLMMVGDITTIIVDTGTTSSITWSSSDTSVVTVSPNGVVSAVGSGVATVTATKSTGASASCEVIVYSADSVENITDEDLDTISVIEADQMGSKKSGVITSALAQILSESGRSMTLTTNDTGSITLSSEILRGLDSDTSLAITTGLNLDDWQKRIVGNNQVYEYSLDDGMISELGGIATISMPYVLKDGENPDDIRVYYIGSDHNIEMFECTYSDGYVTFETTHFSPYFATSEDISVEQDGDGSGGDDSDGSGSEGGSNTMLYVGIVAAVIVVIAVAAAVLMRRNA